MVRAPAHTFLADHAEQVANSGEFDVLWHAAGDRSTAAIAKRLYLSPATVKRHFERAYASLGVSDRAVAVAAAMRHGLIP